MLDPFPDQVALNRAQVAKALGMGKTAFREFLEANEDFPREKPLGKTKSGKRSSLKFSKLEVMVYLRNHGF